MSFIGSNLEFRTILTFAGLILLALFGYLMLRSKAKKKVITAFERLSEGDYSVRLDPAFGISTDEAEAFNRMAQKLGTEVTSIAAEVTETREQKEETLRLQEQGVRLEEELIRTNSDLLRKEVMIEEINQELLAASRVKSEFIANMGRELRTPLNSLVGLADFISSGSLGQLNPRQRQYVMDIKDSAKNLLDLVENILEYTMLEMGGALSCEEVPVKALAEEVTSSLGPMAAAHTVSLTCDVPDIRIWADGKKLKFILYDLLHNAIRFNRSGGRAGITARLTDSMEHAAHPEGGGETHAIEFRVEDTGPGFPSSASYKLFKPFSQLAGTGRAKPKGAGLSLALVKRYVELHSGRVWAESRLGTGSSFSFSLPLAEEPRELKKKKVLVVEDDPDHMLLITRYFDGEPYELLHADNGLDALKVVEEEKPDLVLLDVLLPKMDGTEVCKALKKHDRFELYRHIPVIMITSLADLNSKVKGVQAGADDFLVKPLDRGLLIERVKSLLGVKEEYEKVLASYRVAEKDSISDPLTGLYNRRYMEDALVKEFRNAERYNKNLSVLMIDIDFFKKYNDLHGHQEGDKLLVKLAEVFKDTIREVDVAARYGGEEFIIIQPETPSDMAMVAAERIRHIVESVVGVTVSIGISTYPEDADSGDGLVEKADKALYVAKNSGRNRTEKYSPGADEPASAITS